MTLQSHYICESLVDETIPFFVDLHRKSNFLQKFHDLIAMENV